MGDPENLNSTKDEDILATAKRRFALASEYENPIREKALDDLNFRAGNQWDEKILATRQEDGRPSLTINKLPGQIRQVTNDQRQNRPAIKVNPVDDKADPETAKVLQGMIRGIEYDSNADVAIDNAFEGACNKGVGHIRILTEYSDPLSFKQKIKICPIYNDFAVYKDTNSKEPDGADMNWCFIVEEMSIDDFKNQWPDAELSTASDYTSLGDTGDWIKDDTVRVAEYFYKTYEKATICLLSNGAVIRKDELPDKSLWPEGISVKAERETVIPIIKWCKINGHQILESTDWPSKWIPIIPVYGDRIFIDGEVIQEGVIRHAKDSQRMLNYWVSTETETIALAPRAPFIVAEGQIEGYEQMWQSANRKSHPYLIFKPTSLNGQPVGAPQRNVFEAPVQAITNARMQASEDIKATTGIFDASLGAASQEKSGVAIQRRNAQAQTSNFHFIDNLTRSLKHLGRIIIDLIPKVYDVEQAVRTVGEDGTVEMVTINGIFQQNGQEKMHQLDVGEYDVTVSVGPSYQTKRQEAAESMVAFIQAYPAAAQVIGDLIAKNMDWPGADQIAERLKKTLPPGIADDENKEKQPIPPEAQAQMQQMNQMIDMLTKQLNAQAEEIKTKKMELESKERIEFAKMETDLIKTQTMLDQKDSVELLKAQMLELQRRQELVQINNPIEEESAAPGALEPEALPQDQQSTGGFSPGLPME